MIVELLPLLSAALYLVSFLFICCLPGLAFSFLLFPPARLDFLERVFIACSSSLALSSLLAVGLLLLLGQLSPLVFAAGILILIAIFSTAALWRMRLLNHENLPVSPSALFSNRQFYKPVGLVTALILITLFFYLGADFSPNPLPELSDDASKPSGITEFYISPHAVDIVLEGISDPQGEIVIPLEIVNHNSERAEYHIEVFVGDQKIYEQSGINVAAGTSWQGSIITPLPEPTHSSNVDIKLFDDSAPDPVAQLRLWLSSPDAGQ